MAQLVERYYCRIIQRLVFIGRALRTGTIVQLPEVIIYQAHEICYVRLMHHNGIVGSGDINDFQLAGDQVCPAQRRVWSDPLRLS